MTVNDALRILRKQPKDAFAWEIIAYEVYQPLLAYVASLLLTFKISPSETADDIVHDVLLKFYEYWPKSNTQITNAGALHVYLRASCRNRLIDRYRKEKNAQPLLDFLELRFSHAFQGESEIYRSIFLGELASLMPDECAALFKRFVLEDLSPAEIADNVGEAAAKFNSRWYRCIKRAKELLLKKDLGLKRL
jgi:RNA polymerase sigma factor (sigma-70 family)